METAGGERQPPTHPTAAARLLWVAQGVECLDDALAAMAAIINDPKQVAQLGGNKRGQ